MKERISVLLDILPRYGEILLGVGSVAIESYESILENEDALNELKEYLTEEATKWRNLAGISKSEKFQNIFYNYTGNFVGIRVLSKEEKNLKVLPARIMYF